MSTVAERIEVLDSRARELNVPVNALFELTHRCNLRCFHCYVAPDPSPELDTEEIKRVLGQLAAAGSLFVTFTGGEAMLRRDLWEIVRHARELAFAVRLFTNATLIGEREADTIAGLTPVDVSVSIYGAEAASHDAVTGAPGSFERSVRGLRLLNERGVVTRMKTVLMADNVGDRVAIGRLAEELGATAQFDPQLTPRNDGDASPLAHRLDDPTLREIVSSEEMRGLVPEDGALCSAGRDSVAVSPSGTVNPCLQMPFPLGDLRRESFEDIWHGAAAEQLRALTLSAMRDCGSCADLAFCNPCLGLNLIESGDSTIPSSSVCRVARARRKGVIG